MPDAMIPQVGDIINTNYSVPESPGLRVTKFTEIAGLLYIEAMPMPPCPQTADHTNYFNRFVVDGDRIRREHPWPPGSSGYSSICGGRGGDGYDELIIMQRAAQMTLF
jgi:hypothetical protein